MVEMDAVADVSSGRVASERIVVEVTVPGMVVVDTVCDPPSVALGSGVGSGVGSVGGGLLLLEGGAAAQIDCPATIAAVDRS